MSIDWTSFNNNLDGAITAAGTQTDAQLASQVAALTTLTAAEIQAMYPDPADVKTLAALMQIVKASTDQNTKINQLVANAESFAGILLPLLKKFV